MKIVLATPLYPPDTGEASVYAKEAARRLSEKHDVTVIAYGRLPERLSGVEVISVSKRQPKLMRILQFTGALIRAAKNADVIYLQNGASVELAATAATFATRKPLVLHIADAGALGRTRKSWLLWFFQSLAQKHAKHTFADMPLPRPEILPFETEPREAMERYEASWREHIATLNKLLHHA